MILHGEQSTDSSYRGPFLREDPKDFVQLEDSKTPPKQERSNESIDRQLTTDSILNRPISNTSAPNSHHKPEILTLGASKSSMDYNKVDTICFLHICSARS